MPTIILEDGRKINISQALYDFAVATTKETIWEPEGGKYRVLSSGKIHKIASFEETRLFGTERPNKEQALEAEKLMRTHNRYLAYCDEFSVFIPDWTDYKQLKYFPMYDDYAEVWRPGKTDTFLIPGMKYLSLSECQALIKKLNSKEVEF
jgi:hypothetical protein